MALQSFVARPWSSVDDDSRVAAGVWVVALFAAADAIKGVVGFTIQRMGDPGPVVQFATGQTTIAGSLRLLGLVLGATLLILLTWGVFAGSVHLLAGRLGGSTGASFRTTAGYVGWAFLPHVVTSVLETLVIGVVSPSPPATPADNPAAFEALSETPLMRLVDGVAILLLVWFAVLVVHAAADAHDLTRRQAAIACVIPLLGAVAGVVSLILNPDPIVID